jgi:hypothetical protein
VNTNWRNTSRRRLVSLAATLLAFLLTSSPIQAQSSSILERLSADTIIYLHWRGKTFAPQTEEKNHVLQLLQDPDFIPFRDELAKLFQRGAGKDGAPPALKFAEILSLLENEAAAGIVANAAAPNADAADNAPSPGSFLVYDAAGKTVLVDKLRTVLRASGKEPPVTTTYDFGGTPVEVRTTPTGPSYSARTGRYYLIADQKPLMEDLIGRFRSTEKPASSVTQLPEYKAIQPYIGADSSEEFFARAPDLSHLIRPDAQATPAARFAMNLHLEKLHVMGMSVSFAGEAARLHGAILGDTSSPSLFDIAGASVATFLTLPIVNPGPLSNVTRLDLPATYRLVRSAAMESLNSQQTAGIATGEAMAQAFLGMSIDDALHLFTGEFATESVSSEDGSWPRMYAVAIQKPQDVLRILRAAVGNRIVAENTEGDATLLDISYPDTDPVSGQQKPHFLYVAVTPQVVFVAPKKAMLHDAMARLNAKPGATSSADPYSNADLNRLRALLPEKLSGLSAADLARIPWDKVFAWISQQINEDTKGSKEQTQQSADWLKLMKAEAFARHFHAAISGWWKDSNGIYFDSYLQ